MQFMLAVHHLQSLASSLVLLLEELTLGCHLHFVDLDDEVPARRHLEKEGSYESIVDLKGSSSVVS